MKLVRSIDFDILDSLSDGKRDVAANIALRLDEDRSYVNSRIPFLYDYGLVDRVGPSENSGLYEITTKGQLVVQYQDRYGDPDIDFEEFIAIKKKMRKIKTNLYQPKIIQNE